MGFEHTVNNTVDVMTMNESKRNEEELTANEGESNEEVVTTNEERRNEDVLTIEEFFVELILDEALRFIVAESDNGM